MASETLYAKSGDANIAYQVRGDGPIDIVYIPHLGIGDVETRWETVGIGNIDGAAGRSISPALPQLLTRFARVITFDKRGTGLSGRVPEVPKFEEQLDDVVAVMRAAQSTEAVMLGILDGAVLAAMFAATYAQWTRALVTWMLGPRLLRAPDYQWGIEPATLTRWIEATREGVGLEDLRRLMYPSRVGDPIAEQSIDRRFRMLAGPGGMSAFLTMWADADIRPLLPMIRVPTLVLHRTDAALVPAEVGRYVASHIEAARYVEIEGSDIAIQRRDFERLEHEIEEFLMGAPTDPEPDRVLATVLFTDIVSSTERAADLGDRRWRRVIENCEAIVRQHLVSYRGTEIKTIGDGFLIRFESPSRAVLCARAIRDSLRANGIEIRAGVHTGEIDLVGDDVSGIAVTIAKRIEATAAVGEVLVSRTVVDLLAGSNMNFSDRGHHTLKGVPRDWQLFALNS